MLRGDHPAAFAAAVDSERRVARDLKGAKRGMGAVDHVAVEVDGRLPAAVDVDDLAAVVLDVFLELDVSAALALARVLLKGTAHLVEVVALAGLDLVAAGVDVAHLGQEVLCKSPGGAGTQKRQREGHGKKREGQKGQAAKQRGAARRDGGVHGPTSSDSLRIS